MSVIVRRHPFDSQEARYLVSLLEADLAAMYPDWDELAHPGMHHENNPRPPAKIDHEYQGASPKQVYSHEVEIKDEMATGLVFFVAFEPRAKPSGYTNEDDAVGCGALRLLPLPGKPLPSELDPEIRYAEVKRMYVHSSFRGLGISKIILSRLEQYARDELKLDRLVLETGLRQKAGVGLYTRAGYRRCSMFGEYVGADPESGGDSICMEKDLSDV